MSDYLPALLALYLAAPVWNSWSFALRALVAVGLAAYLSLKVRSA